MKTVIIALSLISVLGVRLEAQELYVSTEPASNMPRNSLGVRLTGEVMPGSDVSARFVPEIMYGFSKNLMAHASLYVSDVHQRSQRAEGYGLYAKYRFLSIDSVQRHLRGAAFARFSSVNNPVTSGNNLLHDLNLEGDNSGWQGGIIITQLLHKLALSASGSYIRANDNRGNNKLLPGQSDEALAYSVSAGYLSYPKVYTNYRQTNINVYLEFLGKSALGQSRSYLEAAPALQLILNSQSRIDISKRFQLYGNMNRMTKNMLLIRLEHNIFNVF